MTSSLREDEKLKLRAFSKQLARIRKSRIGQQKNVKLSKTHSIDLSTGDAKVSCSVSRSFCMGDMGGSFGDRVGGF